MRTRRYSTLRTETHFLIAAWVFLIAAISGVAATLSTTDGSSVTGDIRFTTSGSVFVGVNGQEVTRLKKKELTPESSATVEAWESSNPNHAQLSTKFDSQPQPIKMKNPERTEDIADVSGIVMLAVLVDESGAVEQAFVKDSSDIRFNEPSLTAMQAWEFAPLTKNAQPTRGLMFVPLQY